MAHDGTSERQKYFTATKMHKQLDKWVWNGGIERRYSGDSGKIISNMLPWIEINSWEEKLPTLISIGLEDLGNIFFLNLYEGSTDEGCQNPAIN